MTNTLSIMKNAGMLLTWLLVAALAIASMARSCTSGSQVRPTTILVRDTIRVKADSIVVFKQNIKAIYQKGTARIDTVRDTIIRTLIAHHEQSREQLRNQGVQELLVLDSSITIPLEYAGERLGIALQISDTCDCLARSIRTVVRTRDSTLLLPVKAKPVNNYAFGIGVSAGITSQGFFAATLALSLVKVIASF